jgi:NAD(P)-dependent dehydrogenase (short-subunit alcohol dehydrogenase family)
VAARADHTDDAQTAAVVARIEREAGRLDVLVNNVWGGYETLHDGAYEAYQAPFWTQPLSIWDSMFAAGVRAHYAATALAAPLVIRTGGGLVANVSFLAGRRHRPGENVAYSVAKAAEDRLVEAVADHLRPHGVCAVGVYPGLVRTEGILKWAEYLDLSNSESPRFTGRAVVALAADPDRMRRTGTVVVSAELALEYGFTDVDGAQPRPAPEAPEPGA